MLICPICKNILIKQEKTYLCEKGHTYDISKDGYVNLLLSQKSSKKRHGDDKLMAISRKKFLEKGFYDILLNKLIESMKSLLPPNPVILDAGCGECFYTGNIEKALLCKETYGIDLSKDSLSLAGKKYKNISLCVASIADIPVEDSICDAIINIFAPFSDKEFSRILKPGRYVFRVIPLEEHLWELKKAVYNVPYKNTVSNEDFENFEIFKTEDINETISLNSNEDIQNLFKMTPYYYKTGKEDQEKLNKLKFLETKISFKIIIYKAK